MNKDVIYIEPEDDITDIITKIENSKQKIIALVPPKKASVFRSIVNIKLITKAGVNAEKTIVLVTTDPSIIKLAAAVKLPVTKSLKSAPVVPGEAAATAAAAKATKAAEKDAAYDAALEEASNFEEMEPEEPEAETGVEADAETEGSAYDSSEKTGESDTDSAEPELAKAPEGEGYLDTITNAEGEDAAGGTTPALVADEAEKDASKKSKKDKKKKDPANLSKNPVLAWIQTHKVIVIGGSVGLVAIIIALVWAFAIAPAVTVTVGIRTTTTNFSENITFTDTLSNENTAEGVFYREEKKIESKSEVEFDATGKKNVGERASGSVVVFAYFKDEGSVPVNAGSGFYYNSMAYTATEGITLSWDGEDSDVCDNKNNASSLIRSGCQVSGRVKVEAVESGSAYNIPAESTGWTTVASVDGVYSDKAMTGGTDKTVTIVLQSDVDAAREKLATSDESANKQKLLATVKEGDFVIESSFKQTVSDAVSTPAVGEEVAEGVKPKLSVTTTDVIYVIDSAKAEQFIRETAKLADNYAIYEMKDPFIENYTEVDGVYVAKLKTSYVSGPRITEAEVAEIVKGKGIGTARQDLEKSYDGISKISIEGNYPWVMSVPGDTNKITVNINVDEKE